MNLLQNIHELPRIEKIKVMEFLWKDLQNGYVSPSWHKDALLETEKRRLEGKEKSIDWSKAKKLLRKEFE